MDYLLCYRNINNIMKVIRYLGQIIFMLGNGNVKVLCDLNFFLNLILILCVFTITKVTKL